MLSKKRISRLNIAIYNFITLLRDEHIQKFEKELGNQVGIACNRDRRNEKRRGMFQYVTKRSPSMALECIQRPNTRRLSDYQEME